MGSPEVSQVGRFLTRTGRLYYSYSLAPRIQETGQPVPGDTTVELCTSTGYASGKDSAGNLKPTMIAYPNSAVTTKAPCGLQVPNYSAYVGAPGAAGPVLAATNTYYDSSSAGFVVTGDVTETDVQSGTVAAPGPFKKQSSAGYDSYGRVISATSALGATTTTSYVPTNPAGPSVELPAKLTVNNPDAAGQPTWTTTTLLSLPRSVPVSVTDPNNRTTNIKYDALGRTSAIWLPGRPYNPNSPLPANTKYSYVVNGYVGGSSTVPPSTVESDTLREDNTYARSTVLLDSMGRTKQTQTTPVSDDAGRIVTDTGYDSASRASIVSGPYYDPGSGPSSAYWVPTASTAIPRQTQSLYDNLGRITAVVTVSHAVELWRTSTVYHGVDAVETAPPAGGVKTSTLTDARGQMIAAYTWHPGATFADTQAATIDQTKIDTLRYGYDELGRQTKIDQVVDPTHANTWTFAYDLLGQKTSAHDPDAGDSSYAYDIAGDLTDATTAQAKGTGKQALHYDYDLLGRKKTEYDATSASGTITVGAALASWSYDGVAALSVAQSAANPGSDTNPNRGRPTSSIRYNTSGAQYTTTIGGYDAAGHALSTAVNIPAEALNGALGGTTYTAVNHYTALGQLSSTDLPTGGDLGADSVGYGYNQNGLMYGATDYYGDLLTDSAYSTFGEIQRRVLGDYPNQVIQDTGYDDATHRVTSSTVSQLAWNAPIDATAYAYNPAGQLTAAVDIQGTAGTVTNHIVSANLAIDAQCYHYDYAGRLDAAWSDTVTGNNPNNVNATVTGTVFGTTTVPGSGGQSDVNRNPAPLQPTIGACTHAAPTAGVTATWQVGGPQPYAQVFSFDAATGNRQTETDYTSGTTVAATHNYSYNAPGTAQPHVLTGVDNIVGTTHTPDSYQYNATGSTTMRAQAGKASQTLTWDAEGRLATDKDSGAANASYLYDADGNQLIRRDATGTTLYLGDTEFYLPNGASTATGHRYFTYSGAPTIVETGTATPEITYQAGNSQGTANTTLDASPPSDNAALAVTARRAYTPFNAPRGVGQPTVYGAFVDDHTFLGKTTDTSTGLVDVGARKYEPSTGRFISIDPVLQAGNPKELSGYAYAGNDPVSASDPSGLRVCVESCGGPEDKQESAAQRIYAAGQKDSCVGLAKAVRADCKAISTNSSPAPVVGTVDPKVSSLTGGVFTVYTSNGTIVGTSLVQHKNLWNQFWAGVGDAIFTMAGGEACQHGGDNGGQFSLSCEQGLAAAVGTAGASRAIGGKRLMFNSERDATWGGRVQYGPLDADGRATRMSATIGKDMLVQGTDADESIWPVGFRGGRAGDARGHLLANQLGGSGDIEENLVALIHNPVNTPVMRGFENEVRAAVENGEKVQYTVTPIYQGPGRAIAVTLEAYGDNGFQMNVSILNR